jgi:hypothetical protein
VKKIFTIFVVLSVLSVFVFGGTWIGGGISKELSGQNRTFIEGRATLGFGVISVDLMGQLLLSNPNPTYWTEIYTYVNIDIPIQNFEIYAGFSPTWFFYNGQFNQSGLTSGGYVHGGAALDLKPLRIYADVAYVLDYSPISLGSVPIPSIGAQFGF